ncbi:MAG: hypothetical protein HZR80_20605 [Candidatus Heimdallarchaeota archaeon]
MKEKYELCRIHYLEAIKFWKKIKNKKISKWHEIFNCNLRDLDILLIDDPEVETNNVNYNANTLLEINKSLWKKDYYSQFLGLIRKIYYLTRRSCNVVNQEYVLNAKKSANRIELMLHENERSLMDNIISLIEIIKSINKSSNVIYEKDTFIDRAKKYYKLAEDSFHNIETVEFDSFSLQLILKKMKKTIINLDKVSIIDRKEKGSNVILKNIVIILFEITLFILVEYLFGSKLLPLLDTWIVIMMAIIIGIIILGLLVYLNKKMNVIKFRKRF